MSTTIETGSKFSQSVTSKLRFSKEDPNVESGATINTQDSVTLGGSRFSDLDPATRRECKDLVKQLAGDGRLFVRAEGQLHRADPAEIKERLDSHQPVEVVSRMASEQSSSGSSSSHGFYEQRGFFTGGENNSSASRSSESSERVYYSSSPISEWSSLEWVDTDQAGVRGVANLPASGGSALISSNYESSWERHASQQWGIFKDHEVNSDASGYANRHYRAD